MRKTIAFISSIAISFACAYLAWRIVGADQSLNQIEFITKTFAIIAGATMLNVLIISLSLSKSTIRK